MITPRRTRLIRAADLYEFRRAIVTEVRLKPETTYENVRLKPDTTYVVVPTRAAASQLAPSLPDDAHSRLVTRDQLYDVLHARLPDAPPRLNGFEREALAQAAADAASRDIGALPFQIRPGLVGEMLRFYDQLRRQSQQVTRFDELMTAALEAGSGVDRGAERLLTQTRFLVATFREYERRVAVSGACDEHMLRDQLLSTSSAPIDRIIVTVADWIADPDGLFIADFDLLARMPEIAAIDLVCTAGVLGSGFHERLHNWWPGLEEIDAANLKVRTTSSEADLKVRSTSGEADLKVRTTSSEADLKVRTISGGPRLAIPTADPELLWFTSRDREEELVAIADRFRSTPVATLDRVAVVFKHPLPYIYLAADTLGAAGIPYQVVDALPLAAEPVVSIVDLVLDAVETAFSRESLVALLRSPHFTCSTGDRSLFRQSIFELNHELSDHRYLGGLERLDSFATSSTDAAAALDAARAIARELALLASPRPASQQVRHFIGFLQRHLRALDGDDEFNAREHAARDAVLDILERLASARERHHDEVWTIDDLAAAIRRCIGDETFAVRNARRGIHLLDDRAARYGDFDDMTIVGLIEHEWPERPRRNIFYPPPLLKALGWASEKDRRAADEARFLDVLRSPSQEIALSTFTLDDESLVSRSILLDEVPRARLSAVQRLPAEAGLPAYDTARSWARLRSGRTAADDPTFHGSAGARSESAWSVSALETYTTCPFKFFAQHVLKLEEEPDDEEVMDPRRQGQFVHQVFERFFSEWQQAGHRAITGANLDQARALFTDVVDRALVDLPEGEAGLERTRLLGSSAAAGLGEAVFRMEAERSVPVIERLLEHELRGAFTITTSDGSRQVQLRGKADRVDLLDDGTFRLIDYKLGWPPDRNRALQLPVYSVCAEQRLAGRHGREWKLGEAMYLAFKGPKRVVPLFSSSGRDEMLEKAQQRLADTLDAIARGEFPPTPDDVYRCETCSFSAVCRKDYVGDV